MNGCTDPTPRKPGCTFGCAEPVGGDHNDDCTTYTSDTWLFKSLTWAEEREFRQWARDNFDGSVPFPMWHPVVRQEWNELLEHARKAARA